MTCGPIAPLRKLAIVVTRNETMFPGARMFSERGTKQIIDWFVIVFADTGYIPVGDSVSAGTSLYSYLSLVHGLIVVIIRKPWICLRVTGNETRSRLSICSTVPEGMASIGCSHLDIVFRWGLHLFVLCVLSSFLGRKIAIC